MNLNDIVKGGNNDVDYSSIVSKFPFIYDHVGGHGLNSPKRGVYVCGNKLLSGKIINNTFWSLYQQASNSSVEVEPVPMPNEFFNLLPSLITKTKDLFPDFIISDSTYTICVANEYKADTKSSICGHTDDQKWYTEPPIFCSLTYFPDGEPIDCNYTHRFQVYQDNKWKDVYLKHNSICIMRADIKHRVLPPLQKYRKTGKIKRRINLTFRNICCNKTQPLGFYMGMSNHYRYYGIPKTIYIPTDQKQSDKFKLVLTRYKKLNKDVKIIILDINCKDRCKKKKIYRKNILDKYNKLNLNSKYTSMFMSKNNCCLELLNYIDNIL